MKNKSILSYFPHLFFIIILVISFCKEDIYGNIKPMLTIGNYLELIRIDNIKMILVSFLISFASIILLIVILYPLIKSLTSFKQRKQHLLLFFLLIPTCINGLFKQVYLSSISNQFINEFLNVFLFLIMFYLLKDIDFNKLDAAKDMGDNYLSALSKIVWPFIKEKVIYWTLFLTILGSNLVIFNNNYSLGYVMYNNINTHLHIPLICSILVIEYLLLLVIGKGGKHE